MKLVFEQWLDSQNIPEESDEAFREGIICFKAGAYRASLVFSYLALLLALRERLLTAAPPMGVPEGKWRDMQARLRRDDAWDEAAFDATQQKAPAPVFMLTEDVRAQIAYWRARRNDCAHSKGNSIGSPHTEALWLFITSNLTKLAVIGSTQGLLVKIERHLDPTYTDPGTDATPLTQEIAHAVEPKELRQFLAQVEDAGSIFSLGKLFGKQRKPALLDFFATVLRTAEPRVVTELASHIAADENRLVEYLRAHPEDLLRFTAEGPAIRRLWTVHLFEGGINDFELYTALIRNSLISASELPEAHELVVRRLKGGAPDDQQFAILALAGFGAALERYAFEQDMIDRFHWGNPNALLVRSYLEKFPISEDAVASICRNFSREPCAESVRQELNDLFKESSQKRREFVEVAKNLDARLPTLIPSLTTEGDRS